MAKKEVKAKNINTVVEGLIDEKQVKSPLANTGVAKINITDWAVVTGTILYTIEKVDGVETFVPKAEYYAPENVSAKMKIEREPFINLGLEDLKALVPDVPELLILLGKWWEVKPARNEIRIKIDELASVEGLSGYQYMQKYFMPIVDKLKNIKTVADRLAYAMTYYKPREGSKAAKNVPVQKFSIGDLIYHIELGLAKELISEFDIANNKTKENFAAFAEKIKEVALFSAPKEEVIELED